MTFWDSSDWQAYETAYGDAPGTRARLLASSDWMTRVVDLSQSKVELWRGIRKSYRSLIHAAYRQYDIRAWCGTSDEKAAWGMEHAYRVHAQAAGRQTRPMMTWMLQKDWLAGRRAILILAHQREEPVGFAYFVIHGHWSYYFSGATIIDDLSHVLIWDGCVMLKAHGIRWAELGWQGEAKDAKGKSIEFYKSGFGGFEMPAKEAPCLAS